MWHRSPLAALTSSLRHFDRPWLASGSIRWAARSKLDAAFEFFEKLGVPFWTFHDATSPRGRTFAESAANLDEMVDYAARHMDRTGVRLLWALPTSLATAVCRRRSHEPGS